MKKKLIITGHDFGLSSSVNAGFEYALNHPNNILTDLSLLPNAPGSLEAAKMAKKLKVSVSLCLNLTKYKPLSSSPTSLIDNQGDFLRVDTNTWDFSAIDKFDENDVAREIEAQYFWFIKHVGRKPSALLAKKNEHGDPKILMPLVQKAKNENLPLRTPVWQWKENYAAQSYVEQSGIKVTQNIFVGTLDWKGRWGYDLEKDVDKLISDINAKDGISELLIFVGFVDEQVFTLSSLNWQRGQYLQLLDYHPEVLDRIRSSFDLISYRDL